MRKQVCALFGVIGVVLSGCNKNANNENVLSQRYIHKYGYAVSQEEWEAKNYPGQVVTQLKNGVTVTATYENGILHGPTTYTFAHSQTVETYYLYNWGNKVKEIQYNTLGMPIREKVQLSPTRYSMTTWYNEGVPMLIEEFAGEELVDGQYFTTANDLESRVEKGHGLRILRDEQGVLLAKEMVEEGYAIKKETFYSNGTPESIVFYHKGKLHGEKKTFALGGEPLAVEQWVNGNLHGKSTYYKNGTRYLEITYMYGLKNGIERHYIDGGILSRENDLRHGPSVVYFDGKPEERQWFYAGQSVSKAKFEDMNSLDELVGQVSYDSNRR